ncbi:MAG: transglutaminase domain-containing protein, partial [Neisseriaceae bacterium]
MFALEALAELPPNSSVDRDYVLQADLPQHELKRYPLKSWRKYQLPESEFDLQQALRLPSGYNPRARQLAQQWRTNSRTPGEVVDHALRYFNRQQFFYTLQPPLLGSDSVDDFLFNSRRGFCEHYASSFVFLMRAAGVPARVVTGYMGGELNPVGGYLIVRQSDAHAWAEVWLGNAGWQRVDPTAAVAPARVQQDLASALPISDSLPLAIRGQPQL